MSGQETICEILGYPGRMLSGSKLGYNQSHPGSVVYFNACIFDDNKQQIWFGDIDFARDSESLQRLASAVGKIYVTQETPWRWEGFDYGMKCDAECVKTFEPQEDK